MSEYQYYEFAAIDKPLTSAQRAELRACSTRAVITATSFTNEYHWGDLKADPIEWMRRYFDAHVYSANWASCCLLLRFPRDALDKQVISEHRALSVKRVHSGGAFDVVSTPDHWILGWRFNGDSGEIERFCGESDGTGWMAQLLPLRDELLRGDTRPLYLGWLARASTGELRDDMLEPPTPVGLQQLTAAQTALTEFLCLDPDWLASAAAASTAQEDLGNAELGIDTWLDTQSPAQMRYALRLLLESNCREAERGLRSQFRTWKKNEQPNYLATAAQRSVAEIRAGCIECSNARVKRERKARAVREGKQRTERAKQLATMAKEADALWTAIDANLARGTGSAYDKALRSLIELAEALKQADRTTEFRERLQNLMSAHSHRPAWIVRINKSDLLPGT